jgi:hypothetical protein
MLVEVNVAAIQTLETISHVSAIFGLRSGRMLPRVPNEWTAVM